MSRWEDGMPWTKAANTVMTLHCASALPDSIAGALRCTEA
ncbi:hypothetical protein PXO_05414 [Xanthomonas oryzae pv. oryzae PXO99A]|uniref:Uncharacterized protein n=1 Tax=Xanthomonas oryzae pv. oryzae (strain PXO99A) TaxID=360094 RepID=A0A0K0GFH2_XANOP|nr:hypothetical protein PXO_05414 [Xanthomonas oryzae pv. oryzae PXO99A]